MTKFKYHYRDKMNFEYRDKPKGERATSIELSACSGGGYFFEVNAPGHSTLGFSLSEGDLYQLSADIQQLIGRSNLLISMNRRLKELKRDSN